MRLPLKRFDRRTSQPLSGARREEGGEGCGEGGLLRPPTRLIPFSPRPPVQLGRPTVLPFPTTTHSGPPLRSPFPLSARPASSLDQTPSRKMATMTHRSREDAPAPAQQPSTKADKDKAAAAHARSSSSQAPRKVRFNVGSRYQVLDVIGEGAYGVV